MACRARQEGQGSKRWAVLSAASNSVVPTAVKCTRPRAAKQWHVCGSPGQPLSDAKHRPCLDCKGLPAGAAA